MKKMNFINRMVLLVSALLITSGTYAQKDFNTWVFKSGSAGIAAGRLAFVSKSITVEFWINAPAAAIATNSEIMESWHNPNGIRINMNAHDGGYALRLFAKDNTVSPEPQAASIIIPTEHYLDKWAHIAYVISSDDEKAYAYVNGEYFAEVPMVGGYYGNYRSDGTSTRAFSIATAFWGTPVFNGKLADIRIWSVARTAEEIKANYNKNLIGTYEDNPGLYLNYRFYTYERGFINDANPDVAANKGWCNPEAGWNNYYSRETLSAYPRNLAIADETLSWDTSDGEWEVTIFKSEDNNQVATETVSTSSILLNSIGVLEENTNYYAKVRTLNNGVWSGQVTSEAFTITKGITGINEIEKETTLYVRDGSVIVKAENAQTLSIYSISGQLVRSVSLGAGENVISGLAKGFYMANSHKIVIR